MTLTTESCARKYMYGKIDDYVIFIKYLTLTAMICKRIVVKLLCHELLHCKQFCETSKRGVPDI